VQAAQQLPTQPAAAQPVHGPSWAQYGQEHNAPDEQGGIAPKRLQCRQTLINPRQRRAPGFDSLRQGGALVGALGNQSLTALDK
jgi:hypothetical protein